MNTKIFAITSERASLFSVERMHTSPNEHLLLGHTAIRVQKRCRNDVSFRPVTTMTHADCPLGTNTPWFIPGREQNDTNQTIYPLTHSCSKSWVSIHLGLSRNDERMDDFIEDKD